MIDRVEVFRALLAATRREAPALTSPGFPKYEPLTLQGHWLWYNIETGDVEWVDQHDP